MGHHIVHDGQWQKDQAPIEAQFPLPGPALAPTPPPFTHFQAPYPGPGHLSKPLEPLSQYLDSLLFIPLFKEIPGPLDRPQQQRFFRQPDPIKKVPVPTDSIGPAQKVSPARFNAVQSAPALSLLLHDPKMMGLQCLLNGLRRCAYRHAHHQIPFGCHLQADGLSPGAPLQGEIHWERLKHDPEFQKNPFQRLPVNQHSDFCQVLPEK